MHVFCIIRNDRLNYDVTWNSTVGATILINVAVTAKHIVCQMWYLDMRTGSSGRQFLIH